MANEKFTHQPIPLVPQPVILDTNAIISRNTGYVDQYVAALEAGDITREHLVTRLGEVLAAREIKIHKLEQETLRDSLTGLPNFKGSLLAADKLAKRGKPYGHIVLDLRHFGELNNKYGMPVGDQVLQATALLLENTLYHNRGEDSDVVTHYDLHVVQDLAVRSHGEHGDEFHIFLPSVETEEQLEIVCEKLLRAFEQPIEVKRKGKNLALIVGISVGAAIADGTMPVEELSLALSDEVARIKSTQPDGGYSIYRTTDRPLRRTRGNASKPRKTTGK